jgi:1,2-phenylacetyl-CoA epoxidase catalytic subunit
MELWEKVVAEEGRDVLDMILMIYVNLYYSELDVVDLCARWIPQREQTDEKFMLVEHAWDEVKHAKFFKGGVKTLGLNWDELNHDKYLLKDRAARFQKLFTTDDELAVLVGLNLYAEGVHATEEMIELYERKPAYFPVFSKTIPDEERHVNFGKTVLMRRIESSKEAKKRAQQYCDEWMHHMEDYLWGDIARPIDVGIQLGYLSQDYRKRVASRFEDVMTSVGLTVQWPADSKLALLAA